jgi:hypothetical protein
MADTIGWILVALTLLWALVLRERMLRAPGAYAYLDVRVADAFGVTGPPVGLSLRRHSFLVQDREVDRHRITNIEFGHRFVSSAVEPLIAGVLVGPLVVRNPGLGASAEPLRHAVVHLADGEVLGLVFDGASDARRFHAWWTAA